MKPYIVVLCLLAKPLAAQLVANPVYFSPKAPTGLTLAADFGTTLQTKVGGLTATDKPNNVGARALLGLPMVNVGLAAGSYNPNSAGASRQTQVAATVAVKVFSPPLVPLGISLQAGAGYINSGGTKIYNIPIGVGIAVKPPTPGLSFEPWIAPRVHLTAYRGTGTSTIQTGIGVSGGANLNLPTGLGLHGAIDYTRMSAKASAGLPLTQTVILGLGLHYTFTIPGLPMVPVI